MLATKFITVWPFWFKVWVLILTIPWSGRDFDGLTSRISDSMCSVSPGRTGGGHLSSSAPAPMEPPAILGSRSTVNRIVRAAVCQPLATRPPKNVFAAAFSSRWNGCGSNCDANALISAAVMVIEPLSKLLSHGEIFQVAFVGHRLFLC